MKKLGSHPKAYTPKNLHKVMTAMVVGYKSAYVFCES